MKTGDAVLVSIGFNKYAAVITELDVVEGVTFASLWSTNDKCSPSLWCAVSDLELLPDGPRKVGILSAYESHNRMTLAHEKHCEELARKCKEEKDEIFKKLMARFPFVNASDMDLIIHYYDKLLLESDYQ